MKHLKLDIKAADWLNEDQKKRLCEAFDAVRKQDIQQQGIDFLDLCPDKIFYYQQSMIGILRALSVKGVTDSLGSERVAEIGKHAEELLSCFHAWQDKDMYALLAIRRAYDYSENFEKEINNALSWIKN